MRKEFEEWKSSTLIDLESRESKISSLYEEMNIIYSNYDNVIEDNNRLKEEIEKLNIKTEIQNINEKNKSIQ